MNPRFKYHIEHGQLVVDNREGLIQACKKYPEGAYLVVSKNKPNRSNEQNRYYFGVVVKILSNETGYTVDEMHEILKYKFLGVKEISWGTDRIVTIKDSKSLKTDEFEDYLKRIREWASAELSIYLPLPNEVEY